MPIEWPDGKDFAFSIFDDTDLATLENVRPVYSLLGDLGIRTTKSVWPLKGEEATVNDGDTCEDDAYREWLLSLKSDGFEIGYHMAAASTSERERTKEALDRFAEIFGDCPSTMANHASCRENIYWGEARLSGWRRSLYNLVTRRKYVGRFRGHIEGDPLFWGDLCQGKIKYTRGFVFPEINTLEACPFMPYHDPQRPYVNYWFSSSEGATLKSFNQMLCEENQDSLASEGGACIMYTHFGAGFFSDGSLDRKFSELIRRLSKMNGWFVPVNKLLDFLLERKETTEITGRQRRQLERSWLENKLVRGTS